jgi:hypothetical protein
MRNLGLILAWTIALSGCATDDDPPIDPPPPPPPPQPTALAACADPATPMTTAWQVDNLHAPITAMTRTDRTVVLASEDGFVKTWILPADGGAPSDEPVYGTPLLIEGTRFDAVAAAPSAIAGIDAGGRAFLWDPAGGALRDPIDMMSSAGTFVAVDEHLRWLVGGTADFAGGLTITALDGGTPQGPLETTLWGAQAAAIGHGGVWAIAGDWYGCPALELRDPRDPATVTAYWDACHWDGPMINSGSLRDVEIDPYATSAIAVGDGVFTRFDLAAIAPGPTTLTQIEARLDDVVWLHGDDLAITLGPGGDGLSSLGVWSLDGELLRSETIEASAGLDVDLAAGTILTAGVDGQLSARRCATD